MRERNTVRCEAGQSLNMRANTLSGMTRVSSESHAMARGKGDMKKLYDIEQDVRPQETCILRPRTDIRRPLGVFAM